MRFDEAVAKGIAMGLEPAGIIGSPQLGSACALGLAYYGAGFVTPNGLTTTDTVIRSLDLPVSVASTIYERNDAAFMTDQDAELDWHGYPHYYAELSSLLDEFGACEVAVPEGDEGVEAP